MAIATVAVSAASSVMQYQGQMAQYETQMARKEASDRAARQAAVNRYASQQNRIIQEEQAAAEKKADAAIDATRARGRARAAGAEAGVGGLSVDAVLQDLDMQQDRFEGSVDQNFMMTESYLRGEMEATESNAARRINSVPTPVKPSFGPSLVNIFGSGVSAYSDYKRQNG